MTGANDRPTSPGAQPTGPGARPTSTGARPTGTVTFMFTDIEGSTRLVQQLGTDRWSGLLDRHRELIRDAIRRHGGVEVGTEGDGFFAAFPLPGEAVGAAADVQRALSSEPWPEDARVRVRIGLHTGTGRLDADGTYVGADVHRAARIAAAGHGEQVLISGATRILAGAELPAGTGLQDLGQARLKDLDQPEQVYQLTIDGLRSDFPPLRSLGGTPTNLPAEVTTFLGREREIGDVIGLLGQTRLLTLTGPGGTGKTRLALQVAARSMTGFPDGVWFVALGPISEADLVAPTIAHEVGIPDRGGRNPVGRLIDHFRGKRTLVILDNFEQIQPAAVVVSELVTACSELVILVTSRSALHLYGEREFPVPPLGVPDPQHLPDFASLSQYEAVALFVERARAVKPGFNVTNENAPAVAEIAYRLDGLPLALELAAARIKLLTPQAILARFNDRLDLLSGGPRDLPARQQTLRGAIGWSYDMLEPEDRALFTSFSVFVGGAPIEAVEEVCRPAIEGGGVFDPLASLVDKSLIRQADTPTGEPRFSMLNTIREYAAERLDDEGDPEAVRARHADWYLALVADAAPRLMDPNKRLYLDALEREHDNLRAAITWATDRGRAETALRLGAGLWRFWQMRGYLTEGRERIERALALPDSIDHPEARLAAVEAAGGVAYWQGDGLAAQRFYHESLELARLAGDATAEANAEYNLSFAYMYSPEGGQTAEERARRAREHAFAALDGYRRIGDRAGEARTLWALSNVDWASNDFTEEAVDYARRSLAAFRELDDRFQIGWASYTVALFALRNRDLDEAALGLSESLAIFADAGDVSGFVLVIDAVALLANLAGDRAAAAHLSGAVAELERRTGTGLNPLNREVMEWVPEELRDNPETADAWKAGVLLSPSEAVDAAREFLAQVKQARPAGLSA
jgi:predicted ATPase/class 3 adenylate cyclase